jgi:hypothetical protein
MRHDNRFQPGLWADAFPRRRLVKPCTKRFRGNAADIAVSAATARVGARLAADPDVPSRRRCINIQSGPLARWTIAGRPMTRSPLNNRAPTRRYGRQPGPRRSRPRRARMVILSRLRSGMCRAAVVRRARSGSADHVSCARSGLLGGTRLGGASEGGVRGVSLAVSLGSQRHRAIRRPARRYLLAGFAVGSSAPAVEP